VLFEYLSGSLPFQGKDPTSTLTKILHDQPPVLANFISSYPTELDDVIRRALAKDRNTRYASMEDFVFDLQSVQEKLSRDLIASYVQAAESCMAGKDWEKSRDHLRQVLKLDKQHRRANELLREVQAQIQRQQVAEQVRQIRIRAEEALGLRDWDQALALLDQAVRLDSANTELAEFRNSVRQSSAALTEALRRAESAHGAGDLETAKQAVEQALGVDPRNTAAKALNAILAKEIADRAKRTKIEELAAGARKEIAARHFTGALELLRSAEAIDPGVAEVQQLIRTAAAGREHERRRQALETVCSEIEELLNRDEYAAACAKADEALQSFPQDLGLLKLKGFAERQREAWSRRLFVESQMATAQQFIDSGQLLRAQSILNEALERCPDDSGALSLLELINEGIARQEAQRREADRQAAERRRYVGLQLEAAAELLRAGQAGQALKKLREATVHCPESEEIKRQILVVEDVLAREEADRKRAEQEAQQKKVEVEKVIAASWQFLSTKQTGQALAVLEQSLQRHPDNEDLKSQLEFAQRRLAVEQAERDRADQEERRQRAEIQREVASARQLLDSRKASQAAAGLELALARYPESEELRALLQFAQTRITGDQADQEKAELEARQRQGEVEKELAAAQQLLDARRTSESVTRLEQALRRYPGSEEIKAQLRFAQQQLAAEQEQHRKRAWIDAEITMTRQLVDAKQSDRAVNSLQQALTQYPDNRELQEQLEFARQRLATEQAERERAKRDQTEKREAQLQNEIAKVRSFLENRQPDEALKAADAALLSLGKDPQMQQLQETAKAGVKRKDEEDKKQAAERQRAEERKRNRDRDFTEVQKLVESANAATKPAAREKAMQRAGEIAAKYATDEAIQQFLGTARNKLEAGTAGEKTPEAQIPLATQVFAPGEPVHAATATQPTGVRTLPKVVPPSGWKEYLNWRTALAAVALLVVTVALYYVLTPRTMSVNIETQPAGARIRVGDQTCVTPNCRLRLRAGKYQVDAQLEGYEKSSQALVVDPKQPTQQVSVLLVPTPAPATSGFLVVKTNVDGADVLIDGTKYPQPTAGGLLRVPLDAGGYGIEVQKNGYQPVEPQGVQVRKAEDTTVEFELVAIPATAHLLIAGAPPDVQVLVDGESVGSTSKAGTFAHNLTPGNHDIALLQGGQQSNAIRRKFLTGQPIALNGRGFKLPLSTPNTPSPSKADVVVRNLPPEALVKVDDGNTYKPDSSGAAHLTMPAGNHTIEITADGFNSKRIQQNVAAGQFTLDGALDRVDTEPQAWTKVQSSNDMATLQDFLNRFPKGDHSKQAKSNLDRLIAFNQSDSALSKFHDLFPNTPAGEEAGKRAEELRTAKEKTRGLIDGNTIPLLKRYEKDYSEKNADDICGIWPACPRKTLDKLFKEAASVSVLFQPVGPMRILEGTASVGCTRTSGETSPKGKSKQGTENVTVNFKKQGNVWLIDSIKAGLPSVSR
jgi:hypothetical protein